MGKLAYRELLHRKVQNPRGVPLRLPEKPNPYPFLKETQCLELDPLLV